MAAALKRESGRIKELDQQRTLDEATRLRRLKKQLDALEQDNFQDDPHANLTWHKKIPKFDDSTPDVKKKKRIKSDQARPRFRRTFQQLLEEEELTRSEQPNYFSAKAPPSKLPQRHFCAVCGFSSCYTCVQCHARYCSLKCLGVHKDTRCLKWTV